MQIEHRPDMEKTAGGMTVVTNFETKWLHDRIEARDIGWQLRGPDGGVFDKGNWFGGALTAGQEGKACLA
jgi:hypothetical protein